jgi:hypothetical protein
MLRRGLTLFRACTAHNLLYVKLLQTITVKLLDSVPLLSLTSRKS